MKLSLNDKQATADLCFLQWRGRPAVFIHQAYWSYELDLKKQEVTLLECLGILEMIS